MGFMNAMGMGLGPSGGLNNGGMNQPQMRGRNPMNPGNAGLQGGMMQPMQQKPPMMPQGMPQGMQKNPMMAQGQRMNPIQGSPIGPSFQGAGMQPGMQMPTTPNKPMPILNPEDMYHTTMQSKMNPQMGSPFGQVMGPRPTPEGMDMGEGGISGNPEVAQGGISPSQPMLMDRLSQMRSPMQGGMRDPRMRNFR